MSFMPNNPDIRVVSLTLNDTGSFGDQVLRTYETRVDGYSINALNESINNSFTTGGSSNYRLNPGSLSSAVGNLISVSAAPKQSIHIDNGWDMNRLRFLLVLELNSSVQRENLYYYFQGYTNHRGIGMGGSLDPNMLFEINSFVVARRVNVQTPMGNTTSTRVADAVSVVNLTGNDLGRNITTIRPSDLFANMQTNETVRHLGDEDVLVFDNRTTPLVNEPVASSKRNYNPTDYLSTLINSYSTGMVTASDAFTDSGVNINRAADNSLFGVALSSSRDPLLSNNPFIRALSHINSNPSAVTRFTLRDLADIDPNTTKVINYIDSTKSLRSMQSYANYESWGSQTREAVAATMIFNSLSSMMMEMFVMNLSIVSTNSTMNGAPITTVVNANTPDNQNLPRIMEHICARFENEVMWGLSFNNQETFNVEINIDLYGSSAINISFNGDPMTPFQRASFADSLYQPVVCADKFLKDNISNDIETLLTNVEIGSNSIKQRSNNQPQYRNNGFSGIDTNKFI